MEAPTRKLENSKKTVGARTRNNTDLGPHSLHGRRVTLLEGLPSLEGQKIALLYMCRVIPGAVLPAKGAET